MGKDDVQRLSNGKVLGSEFLIQGSWLQKVERNIFAIERDIFAVIARSLRRGNLIRTR